MKVELDRWDADRCHDEVIEVDTSSEMMHVISRLDGEQHTLMNITTDNDSFMIGGGPNQFVVVRQISNGSSMSLHNGQSNQTKEKVYLCVGGQEGDYDPHIIVGKALIKSLIDDIFEKRIDSDKIWLPD